MSEVEKVLIVGGGIAGQTCAAALTRRGILCHVVELKDNFEIVGAGMYTQGNALRALLEIGVVEEIVKQGWHRDDDTTQVADSGGNVLARARYPRIAGPSVPAMVPISRRVLHKILHRAAQQAGVATRMGTTITSLMDIPSRGRVDVAFTDGTEDSYDLVVGADGIHSRVRDLSFGPQQPRYTGFVNWRVVLPKPAEVDIVTWMNGNGTTLGVIPISETELYLAGVIRQADNRWYEKHEILPIIRSTFAEYGGVGGQLVAQLDSRHDIVYTPIVEIELAPPWYRNRVVIVGDAAHASTPFWAQGASMAIEDVVLLAQLVEAGGPLSAILSQWMERRLSRCSWVQQGSRQTGEMLHEEGPGMREKMNSYVAAHFQQDVNDRYSRFAEAI
ncbi:FAD-dependent monooxygenase [Bradyrhizobium sp. AUGA SZCCT0042]|uniref:FAD-dependent monooxygenase n=1 Tax=Bradyrhizobium sp. AUGA SZCCT0042 TaxID=2807651 RepID=UPI001BA79E29|nr:FAD-dependent monooxygenase [Bradyrhizobium sp. AUGA SZCCT0042]MBR1297367.1 FAD-dependent monooxygenase [Bradyrhizobium sp. AUGA SZCCT0042]